VVTDTTRPSQTHKPTDRTDNNTLRRWLASSVKILMNAADNGIIAAKKIIINFTAETV